MTRLELCCTEFGPPDAAPLIILHGFFASSRNWRLIAEKLAADHRVFVVDQRNHGASPHHPVMDYPALAADVCLFMERRGLARATLLGHSMGGKVAMWLALNEPARLDKLIIADIAPVSYRHRFDPLIAALKALPLASLRNRKQAEEGLADAIPDLGYRQFLLQNLVLENGSYQWRIDLDIFAHAAPAIVAFPDTARSSPFLGRALFIAGAESNFVQADAVRPLFPTAELITLEGAGHWLHTQQPARFTAAVQAFLSGMTTPKERF